MMKLSGKHRMILDSVFADPVRSNALRSDVEAMLAACAAEIEEGRGSRVRVAPNGVVFHRSDPAREADKGALKPVRRLLIGAGVGHDDDAPQRLRSGGRVRRRRRSVSRRGGQHP